MVGTIKHNEELKTKNEELKKEILINLNMNNKKIWFLIYILLNLLVNFLFAFSLRTNLLLAALGVILYIVVTQVWKVKSVNDMLDKWTAIWDKTEENAMMQATLNHRKFLQEQKEKELHPTWPSGYKPPESF